LFEKIEAWPWKRIEAELEYMANTIPSSWEFVEYKFLINGVTRGFTHQFVRTRTASYAQQTMRVLNVDGWGYGTGPTVNGDPDRKEEYDDCMSHIADTYNRLIKMGAKIEDARGVLPTNIHTNIVAKFDLRSLADTARKRASSRTQGEYRDVMDAMMAEVKRVHPWVELFTQRSFDKAAKELEERITILCKQLRTGDIVSTNLIKLIDQMRMTA
jgi:thymidylate synthase (FAD)